MVCYLAFLNFVFSHIQRTGIDGHNNRAQARIFCYYIGRKFFIVLVMEMVNMQIGFIVKF